MEKIIKELFGFVYITTNLINGKRYVGRCKMETTRPNAWKYYLGSGHVLKEAIKKYGKENFLKNIISFAYSDEELNKQEIETIKFLNAVKDENYYNISDGLYCNPWENKTEEEQKEIREKIKNKSRKNVLSSEEYQKYIEDLREKMSGENNPFYGKHHTEETKRIISEKATLRQKDRENAKPWLGITGERHPLYGRHLSEEARKKMSEAAKKKFENGFVHGRSQGITIYYKDYNYKFSTMKECFQFLKEQKIIDICYDTFKKRIHSNQDFNNFTYILTKKDGFVQK